MGFSIEKYASGKPEYYDFTNKHLGVKNRKNLICLWKMFVALHRHFYFLNVASKLYEND